VSIWLVGRLGIMGVALGTMVPAVALEYAFLRFVLRELGVGWGDFSRHVVAPAAGPAALSFLPLAVAYWRLDHGSALLLPIAACCSVAYAALFWVRSLSSSERSELLAHVPFRNRLPFVAAGP